MPSPRFAIRLSPVALIFCAGVVLGQNYPSKSIRIVTSTPGGGADVVARLLAQGMAPGLGQQVIVDNRASGVIPGEIVAKAAADGYTLLLAGGTFTLGPLMEKTPYDPVKDFSPITLATSAPIILVINPSLPITSVKELIAYAKAKPGELNDASVASGSTPHLAAELFKAMAGVNIVRVAYKGTVQGLNDLIAGNVQLSFATAGGAVPFVKSGRLRGLAVTSARPSILFPDLPTIAQAGLAGYEAVSSYGLFAPAGTPAARIKIINQEAVRYLRSGQAKERLLNTGAESVGSSPEEFLAAMKSEIVRMSKVIKALGIRAE